MIDSVSCRYNYRYIIHYNDILNYNNLFISQQILFCVINFAHIINILNKLNTDYVNLKISLSLKTISKFHFPI